MSDQTYTDEKLNLFIDNQLDIDEKDAIFPGAKDWKPSIQI